MKEARKCILFILMYYVLGFCFCIGFVFFNTNDENIIPLFAFSWKMRESLLFFITLMPMLFISGIFFGYSVIFGKSGLNTVDRKAPVLLGFLKGGFILSLFCITIYLVFSEGVTPRFLQKQETAIFRSEDFHDYKKGAEKAFTLEQYELAERYITRALEINPNSESSKEFLDKIKMNIIASEDNTPPIQTVRVYGEDPFKEQLTADHALLRAKKYLVDYDFYTAHYYAMRAFELSNNKVKKDAALQVAAEAWTEIEKSAAERETSFERILFQKKKQAYELLQQDSVLQSYYLFLDIQKELYVSEKLIDTDVDKFVQITRDKVLESFFFIDEVDTPEKYESARNIRFLIKDNSKIPDTEVFIEGFSYIRHQNRENIYLRNCIITQYALSGAIRVKFLAPYAKLHPQLNGENSSLLKIQMQAVDRTQAGVVIAPQVLEGEISSNEIVMLDLPISFNDFDLIVAASKGEKSMNLAQLYYFKDKGARYGFSQSIFNREILLRLLMPLLMFILAILSMIFAWQFKVPPRVPFKIKWSISIILIPFLVQLFIETAEYACRLLIVLLDFISSSFALFIGFPILVFVFVLVSIIFFYQRAD